MATPHDVTAAAVALWEALGLALYLARQVEDESGWRLCDPEAVATWLACET